MSPETREALGRFILCALRDAEAYLAAKLADDRERIEA